MNIYETIWMLAAIEELPLEHTFFKSRYFPTDDMMDVFNTSKVLADYREGKRKKAPFVVPRIGSLPVGREGFKTYELEPAYIGLSMPLTIDQLQKRGFGESIMSGMTPEERAKHLQLHDMEELSARISRTEEWMACQTMLNNGCVMRHETDVEGVYEDVEVKFYDEETNPALFTPAAKWTHSTISTKGEITVGNWYEDIYQMLARQKRRGMPATDLLVSSDVGAFLMEDPWVLRMLDNRRVEMGRIQPTELTEYVTHLGAFNFKGRLMDILVSDGGYEDEDGTDKAYLDDGSAIVTAPNVGRGLYGAITQMERDEEFHTYAGKRVPQHIADVKSQTKETKVACSPLMVPVRKNPWCVAKKVLG